MSSCVRNSGMHHTMKYRQIQEAHNDVSGIMAKRERVPIYEKPPGLAHSPPGGQYVHEVQEHDKVIHVASERKRTLW
eukprot:6184965-Amphidinium_carterae.1